MDLITYALCHKSTSSSIPQPSPDDNFDKYKIIQLNPVFSQPALGEDNLSFSDVENVYNIDFEVQLTQEDISRFPLLDEGPDPVIQLNGMRLWPMGGFTDPSDGDGIYFIWSSTNINSLDGSPAISYLVLNIGDFSGMFANRTTEEDEEQDSGSELPSVTAADEGKDLTVNASGEWVAGKTASWTATVSVAFAAQSTTVEIGGTSFTKVSDKAFTAAQLNGAVFSMQGRDLPITSAMLIDMSSMGVTGTMIDLTSVGFGPAMFSCTEAGNVVSEPGFYLAAEMISYAPLVTMSYTASLTASTRAIGAGDMEMEDGVTDLPTGVVWLQTET